MSRKEAERTRFGAADFSLYFAVFFLNILYFSKNPPSSMKKSARSELLAPYGETIFDGFRLIAMKESADSSRSKRA